MSHLYEHLLPNKHLKEVEIDESRVYCGRFSTKGNLYYCSSQRSINVYDAQDPYNWSLRSSIEAAEVSWTVCDMDVTADE